MRQWDTKEKLKDLARPMAYSRAEKYYKKKLNRKNRRLSKKNIDQESEVFNENPKSWYYVAREFFSWKSVGRYRKRSLRKNRKYHKVAKSYLERMFVQEIYPTRNYF